MKRILYPAIAFAAVFLLHGAYSLRAAARWVSVDDTPPLSLYLHQQDYFMGLSYGLAAAFTVYSFMRFSTGQRGGLTGTVGGLTLTGALYFGGCFLTVDAYHNESTIKFYLKHGFQFLTYQKQEIRSPRNVS